LKNLVALLGWILLCFIAAGIGAVASANAPEFYGSLKLPDFAPPASVFGPTWTALYMLMAIAAWLVWRERGLSGAKAELILFLVQLAANAVWSWLFFAWRQGLWSFVDIVVLWVLIVATFVAFWRVRPLAGILLLPYLVWVTFAALLNLSIWRLNPGLLA
jgi:translocator protein